MDIQRVIKECFWDYNISSSDILDIAKGDSMREKQKLFSKILYNSTNSYQVLKYLFSIDTLKELFSNFRPTYQKEFILKRYLILRNIFFGEKNRIKELEWQKL